MGTQEGNSALFSGIALVLQKCRKIEHYFLLGLEDVVAIHVKAFLGSIPFAVVEPMFNQQIPRGEPIVFDTGRFRDE